MKTIKLEKQFKGKGEVKDFKFTKVEETERGYIYKVNDSYYEVFKKKTAPICLDFETRTYSADTVKEIYPKSNDFGAWAWAYNCILKANKRLHEL
jgi:hypothetical protein